MIPILGFQAGASCFVHQAVFGTSAPAVDGRASRTDSFETICFAQSGEEFHLEGVTKTFGTPKALLEKSAPQQQPASVSLLFLRRLLATESSMEREKALVDYVELMKETLQADRSLFDLEFHDLRLLKNSSEATKAVQLAYSLLFPYWSEMHPVR